MTNIADKVGEAKTGIEEAKLNLLDVYLVKLRDVYTAVPPELKDTFLSNLEQIVVTLEQNPCPTGRSKFKMPGLYDPYQGRSIRENAGLSAEDLGETLSTKSAYRQIYRYESGETSPRPTTKIGKKYLLWLKEQGYNPYNL